MDHDPVLVERMLDLLVPALERGGVVVDATLGRGGHARRLLDAAPGIELVGIDRDPAAVDAARAVLAPHSRRVRIVRDNFARLPSVLERLGIPSVRGVLFDLGVSSPQLDEADRGFSFRHDGPLDMRMDPSGQVSAHDVVNVYPEPDLARVIRRYGEERCAHRIARRIVSRRPLLSTADLAAVVKDAIPAPARRSGGHPARRTFQAIRIEVNDELGALESGLPAALDVLEPGGRIAVISYHSLEDRIVKRFFADEARGCICPPDFPVCRCGAAARLRVLTRRPLRPSQEEVDRNPRASAAKLRAAERIEPAQAPVPNSERAIA
jgi:16S rRNA (cytosine1402-N4)-methyltransferase